MTFHTAKSFCWAWLLVTFSYPALAAPIYQETLQGNGETRLLIERSLNVAESGRYFLTLKNGDLGPRNIEQCESEDTVSAKRECLFENLNERIEQNFTRMRDALIHVNGVRVRHSLAPNERTITQARGLLKIPVELTQGVNTLKVDYLGYSTAKLHLDLEKAPETPSAPFSRFLLNRITGNTTQEFRLNARESFSPEAGLLSYAWTWGDEADGFVPVPSVDTLVTHTYQTAGTYHAKLVVTDTLSGLSSEFGIDLVVTAVNPNTPPENESPKPIIQWAVDPLNPMRVTFNASQSSDDGEIASYAWRFTNQAGQHTNLTGETLSYTFFNPGSYTVRLGVTDNLGKTAYQTRVISLAPLSELVHDEILLTQNNYFGTFETEAIYTENISIPEAKLGKIRIKNADGQDHPIQDCSLIALPEKIGCLYDNLVNRTYVQLYRVSSANIYVNGRKVTDSLSINKQKKDFETVVSLNQTNTIEIRVRGWPTAFVNVEIQALETNLPPVAVATHSAVKRGAPQTIELQATQSTDPNDQVVSYRFQAKQEGSSAWTQDTDWQASGIANLTFPSVGRWQVLTSARDKFGAVGQTENLIEILPNSLPTLQITYGIYTNQTPYRVQVRANSTDADGDTLLYNFAFSNGQTTGFQALSTAVSMFNVSGNQSVTVSVRDQNGGETVGTASFVLGGNLVPIASFSFASPRAGYAPHTVSFDASNSSDPDGSVNDLQYFWNFGDGTTGAGKLVDHTFQLGGEYIVTLTVLDPLDGAGSQSRAIFSWTNEPPVPRYTVTAVPGTLQRIFNASGSTPGDSAIQRYNFETGDGNFIVQTTPIYTHTYSNGGVYNTSLRVYDAEGDANITGQTITVFNGQNPAANINLVAADVVTPATFIFNTEGSASPNNGATINGWRWTLPDGQIVLGPELFYQTNTHGNFSITLQVRDSFGFWSDPVTQEFSATTGVLPIARIEASKTSATPNEPIRFSGLTSSTLNANANLVSYEWSTPSGTKFYGPEVDIGLSQLGLNTVTLIVTDSKGYVSEPASFQVNISTPTKPVAIFTLSDAGNIIPIWRHADGRDSYATALGASIIGYEWRIQAPDALPNGIDFNLYGPEVDILFNQAVTYTVSLRVFDSSGETSDWVSQTFGPLQNTKPIANFLPGSITVTAPAIINFSSLGSFDPDGHDIIGYYWDMGDGLDRYESNFQHQYNLPGVYNVEFAVQDSFGLWSDPVFATITVVENELPIPVITMQDDPGGNRFKKLFSGLQSSDPDGTIVQYNWFVSGSPIFSTGPETEFTFPAPGHYTMGLGVVDNNGGAAIAWYSLEIPANAPPVANIRIINIDHATRTLSLTAADSTHESEALYYAWTFSDGETSDQLAPSHTFPFSGPVGATLTVTDSTGATSTAAIEVEVYDQPLRISARTASGNFESLASSGQILGVSTIPSSVEFSIDSGDTTSSIVANWTFSDGTSAQGSTLSKTILSPSGFSATATFVDHNGQTQTQSVQVLGTEESCMLSEADNSCFVMKNALPNAVSLSQDNIELAPLNRELPPNPQAEVTITQGATSKTFTSEISISNGILVLPTSLLKDADFDQTQFYEVRIVVQGEIAAEPEEASEEDPSLASTIPQISFAASSAKLYVDSSHLPLELKVTSDATLRVQLWNITSTETAISNFAEGTYKVESESGVLGTISLSNSELAHVQVAPTNDFEERLRSSVIQTAEPPAGMSSLGATNQSKTSFTKSLSQQSQLMSQSGGDCTLIGLPCEYALLSSPYQTVNRDNFLVVHTRTKSQGKEYLPGYQTFGGYELTAESFVRTFDEKFAAVPGETIPIECKGHTTAWNRELLADLSGTWQRSSDIQKTLTQTQQQMLYRFEQLSEIIQLRCSYNQDDWSCENTLRIYGNEAFIPEWKSYVAWRTPIDELRLSLSDEFQNLDYNGAMAYETGTVSKHASFKAKFTVTRYNSDGSIYRKNQAGETDFKTSTLSYDTAKMRGNYSREQAKFNRGHRLNPFSMNDAKSAIHFLRIPPDWADFRIQVKLSGEQAYVRKAVATYLGADIAESHSSFACRPVARQPAATITWAGADPAIKQSLDSYKKSTVPTLPAWEYQSSWFRPANWQNLDVLSITQQQKLLESRTSANPTLQEVHRISDASAKTVGRWAFEAYKANAFFSASETALFPMGIDLDTTITRNPAYSILMHTSGQNFQSSLITESDFDIRFRVKFAAHKVQSISRVNVLLNDSVLGTYTFPEPIKVNTASATTYSPLISIPYQTLRNAVSAHPGTATGQKFKISFSTEAIATTGQTVTTPGIVNVSAAPVWNLKTEVTDPSGTTPDEQKGIYSQRVSAYGGYKLREVVRSIVNLRNANAGDEEKKFRLFINDGSLPFGGSFSPHKTHSDGNVLDIRPLGNTGQSENHYDFARGQKRLEDLAVVWAESVYRNDMCMSFAQGTEQRETCETNAKAAFISRTPGYNERLNRVVKWIKLNHQLGEFPDTVVANPKFRFSNGTGRFWTLCGKMHAAYRTGSNGSGPPDVCAQKIDGSQWTPEDMWFQTRMLEGLLPNNDSISAGSFDDGIFQTRYRQFTTIEAGHFDHFHIETSK